MILKILIQSLCILYPSWVYTTPLKTKDVVYNKPTIFRVQTLNDTLHYTQVETQTYIHFIDEAWAKLIVLGEHAIEQQIDYYALRMRIGIAYYNQKKYFQAAKHFQKAFQFNSGDTLVQEYLYFSLLFSDQPQEATYTSRKFDSSLNAHLRIKQHEPLKFIYLEAGQKNSRYDAQKLSSIGTMSFMHVGVAHSFQKVVHLYHGYSYLQQDFFVGNFKQHEYYVKAEFPRGKGWTISPAIHLLFSRFLTKNVPIPVTTANTYFVGSLQVEKYFSMFRFATAISYGTLAGTTQVQVSPEVTLYPLQTTKLALTTSIFAQTQSSKNYFGMKQAIRMQVLQPLSIQLDYFQGTMRNFNESNAYLVNNSVDVTQNRISVLTNLAISTPFQVYMGGQFEQKEEFSTKETYQYGTFLAGLKYNF